MICRVNMKRELLLITGAVAIAVTIAMIVAWSIDHNHRVIGLIME